MPCAEPVVPWPTKLGLNSFTHLYVVEKWFAAFEIRDRHLYFFWLVLIKPVKLAKFLYKTGYQEVSGELRQTAAIQL